MTQCDLQYSEYRVCRCLRKKGHKGPCLIDDKNPKSLILDENEALDERVEIEE